MARAKLDHIIIIDIEATCWEGSVPEGQENEIIEIGITLLDIASGQRHGKRSILVRPERSTISAFCTQLTTLTQEQVAQGISFAEACMLLHDEYATKEHIWASYGDYDRAQFERQCLALDVPYPFGTKHINIKTLLAVLYGLPRELGMASALRLLSIPLEGTHHRGDDDAWNIAAIFAEILKRYNRQIPFS